MAAFALWHGLCLYRCMTHSSTNPGSPTEDEPLPATSSGSDAMDSPVVPRPAWRRYAPYAAGGMLALAVASWLLAGSSAHVYRAQCASCHGTPGHDVAFAKSMFPSAPPLWKNHGHGQGVIGVSDDEPGETYWKIANGIRLSGMPAYSHILSDTQMWQVSLLLKNADKEMPAPVTAILNSPTP